MKREYPKTITEAAKLLDEVKPGWQNLIKTTLVMGCESKCIIGQIYKDYIKGFKDIFDISPYGSNEHYSIDEIFGANADISQWNQEIKSRTGMSFIEAIQAMFDGKKVRSKDWHKDCFVFYEAGKFIYQNGDIGNIYLYKDDKFELFVPKLYFKNLKPGERFKFVKRTKDEENIVLTRLDGNLYMLPSFNTLTHIDNCEVVRV